MAEPPVASLSFDLDNQWSYMKTHGNRGWESFPSFFDALVPRALALLGRHGLRITFFVVGQDAALEKNAGPLAAIAGAGHEIGNHSFHHEPWLHLYSPGEADAEVARAEEAIATVTGRRPVGFRGPGYSVTDTMIEVLSRRGYLYDASTLPTFIGPLARAYYFRTARLNVEERRRRRWLFGTWRDGLRPIRPYVVERNGRRMAEIPVTTMPFVRTPIHFSYLLYLGRYSRRLATLYAAAAVRLCAAAGIEPSVLLHPLDFLDRSDAPGLSFFPAMDVPAARKLSLVDEMLAIFGNAFRWVSLEEHARRVLGAETGG